MRSATSSRSSFCTSVIGATRAYPAPGGRRSRTPPVAVKVQHRQERLAAFDLFLRRARSHAPLIPDDDHGLLRTRDAGVEQVPVVHEGVTLVDHEHHTGDLTALIFVNRK